MCPLLVLGSRIRPMNVGRRESFSDLGATVADWFGMTYRGHGRFFLSAVTW